MSISASINIFLIDSNVNQRGMVKNMLKQIGLKNINGAETCEAALDKIKEFAHNNDPVKCIMLTYDGQDNDPSQLAELHAGTEIPLLILTSNADPDFIRTLVTSGYKNILLRPYSMQAFKAALLKILK